MNRESKVHEQLGAHVPPRLEEIRQTRAKDLHFPYGETTVPAIRTYAS